MDNNAKLKAKKNGKEPLANQFEQILNRLDREILDKWIITWSNKDPKFRDYFMAEFGQKTKEISIEKFERIIDHGIAAASDRDGYIDYDRAGDVVYEIYQLMEQYTKAIKTADPAEVVSLCFAVVAKVAPVLEYADDSSGEISGVVDQAIELLVQTIEEHDLSPELRKEIWSMCVKYYDTSGMDIDSWDTTLLGIAGELTETSEQRETLFSLLDNKDKGASWHYTNERTAKIRHAVILKLEGEEAAETFLGSMMHLPEIRKQFVERHIREKNYPKAKALCEQGLQMDNQYAGLVSDWQKYLLRIAELENDTSEIIRLSTLLYLGHHNDPQYYNILKKHVPAEQWPVTVEILIQKFKDLRREYACPWIYIQEGMFDRLLGYVKSHPSVGVIEEYEIHLKKKYPDELLALYEKAIRFMAQRATDRKSYAECCRVLIRMKKAGQPERVNMLVAEFRSAHSRQPAFLDELRKV